MNVLNLFTKTYARLHNYSCIPYWVMTPFRRMVRGAANVILPHYLAKSHIKKRISGKGIIISFTSFPARINNVWQVVECMLRQTYRPSKIILWLSKEQFPNTDDIPNSLRVREGELFEIRMVEGDIRSHKKYYYAAKEYPDSFIFLIDDDIYYPSDLLEKAWTAHLKYPDAIISNYAYRIRLSDIGGLPLSYTEWDRIYESTIGYNIFFGSGGGTLFQPATLYKDLTNLELSMRLTPQADDIWLNTMSRLNHVPVAVISNGLPLPIKIASNICLSTDNLSGNNDRQFSAVIQYYEKEGINCYSSNLLNES